ncbi:MULTISPECIES: SPFH domain-containing protein [unclassified Bacteroides]|jgi:regulator of protease activity HflC (stomatin/prohibitin superfamily)|uniref:SPFH domain-containing protein n=1 Tax=unclassified Bacteroides TaxID=2646097 RepID=UPI000E9AFA74|nr:MULTISPECIES: SPFH domain-containing protein [unclassified Bacteroides]RGN47601.1 SPFH domain-containing protein [Bacteroides sp. OM05-12]RHR75380.1 SPFH domain-containing protein [Bacteroides sp. AF16-49]
MIKEEIDFKGFSLNGFLMLFISIVVFAGCAYLLHLAVPKDNDLLIALSVTGIVLSLMTLPGYFALEPNEALIMIFFGKYSGTFKNTGFYWVNPFYAKKKVSLRARNLDVEPIKVNDKIGNPVLIGLVLVWKLKDTYKAMFDIDAQTMASSGRTTTINNAVASRMSAFENFVMIQSDAALRQVAGQYAYDDTEHNSNELTLRGGGEEINEQLEQKLNERLAMAGMEVVEARLNYLAYAPEIAAVMLRRQQASAIICAREKIVEGAVSMVSMALQKLSEEGVVELDEEKKAAMVSNLMVVLCADEAAQPVINAGTLNH